MFKRRHSSPSSWIACAPQASRLTWALVDAGERPVVRWIHAEPGHGVAALRRGRRAAPRGHHANVALLSRSQYQVLQTEAPDMPRDEWRDALRWRLKDQLEFPVDGAALDVLPLPSQAGARHERTVIAVAAPAAARDAWRQDGEDAGWRWDALDVGETALRNLSALLASPNRAHALLHLGDDHATLVITTAGHLLLSRHVDVSLKTLTERDESVRQQALERAGLELQRTLDNFERVFGQVSLERLDVLPGPAAEGVADFVRELVYVPVLVGRLQERLDLSRLPADVDISGHWLAIGAALRQTPADGMATPAPAAAPRITPQTTPQTATQAPADASAVEPMAPQPDGAMDTRVDLNLDPPQLRPKPQPWRASQALWAGAGALAGAWALAAGLNAWAQVRAQEAAQLAQAMPERRAALEAHDPSSAEALARLATERDRLQRLDAQQRQLRSEIDDHLQRASLGHSHYFAALSRQAQPSVWITGFSVAPQQGAIELQGGMTDAAALPPYLQRLNQEGSFKGRRFGRLQLARNDQGQTRFTLAGAPLDRAAEAH